MYLSALNIRTLLLFEVSKQFSRPRVRGRRYNVVDKVVCLQCTRLAWGEDSDENLQDEKICKSSHSPDTAKSMVGSEVA